MARPLRIEAPGLWHHVMNRGLARSPIFLEDADREGFLELLGEARERWGLRTHAACLMDNHFHLLVDDPEGMLGRAMRHVLGVHTQRMGRRHGRDGPLFRGRFRSRLVQHERYLAEVVRYIHMNPVEAGLVGRAGDYAWSSHRHYVRAQPPAWLVMTEVMRRFGGDRAALDTFVHARVPAERREQVRWQASPIVLGDEEFVAAWRERLRRDESASSEAPAAARRWLALGPGEVIEAAAAHFEVSPDSVRSRRRRKPNPARQAAVLICVDHTPHPAQVIGEALGIRPTSLSPLAGRYRRRLRTDPGFRADIEAILHALRSQSLPTGARLAGSWVRA